jgi:hypothetical protein
VVLGLLNVRWALYNSPSAILLPHCVGLCFIHVSLRVCFTGSSSARIVVTLVHALRQRGLKRGIASACIGGGEAMAVAVEVC